MKLVGFLLIAILITPVHPISAESRSANPCLHSQSNADEHESYAREQKRVNREADSLATNFATQFRKAAEDEERVDKGSIDADLLRKGAEAIIRSQEKWKAYRDEQCQAVSYSMTLGSGAGTAYENCMFELGRRRVKELKVAFGEMDFSHAWYKVGGQKHKQ